LAKYFIVKLVEKNRKNIIDFTPSTMDCLARYDWPGNVRELENAIERAVVLCNGNYITERDLPPPVMRSLFQSDSNHGQLKDMAGLPLEEIEREAIMQTLQKTSGNKSEAAKLLNITRTTLNNKIKKYNISIQQST
jgi:two-component system response regulator HydG